MAEQAKENNIDGIIFNRKKMDGHISNHSNNHSVQNPVDRLKILYPNVNEQETPLPRSWSPHDKCHAIGLSQNNLRVHYKGPGKTHSDAAAVRTSHPIPAACGLYYFEVKIISKGKNGYMGIGLTSQTFKMNRLPGWDKNSYGYHGDDGNSFCSSGSGQPYGPTFTTGDVIGCGVNLVNNTCFYTKNGIDLGIAFRDLPSKLYPTVGLQTPGEEVNANFGQEPFKFDQIEDMIKQMRAETKTAIYNFPMPTSQGDSTVLLHKMVSSYLVHSGYSLTAESFAKTTGQSFGEDLTSIKNRQKILKLVMSGRMGQAIEHTCRLYPGLLENNKNLLFMLKCRQFIEMVNGSDIECPPAKPIPNQTSVIQSTKSYQNGSATQNNNNNNNNNNNVINDCVQDNQQEIKNNNDTSQDSSKCNNSDPSNDLTTSNSDYINDIEMENGHISNGNSYKNGNTENNFVNSLDTDEDMEIDVPTARKVGSFERILEFGRELSQMGQQLEKDNKMNDDDRQMLEDAFSLIAYSNPWSSPLGWQLCPSKREKVCSALNSAILESMNYSWRPPLEICVAHAHELLRLMANNSLGACAFVNIEDVFPKN
ncbi:ran-binding proteins 9/10 homolog [Condylostylus longicornis]|uniref:ran-binding proteins 9/10 homolog n=1 Tax=Condylostylus longicornis TaxID=2530218 RepID=UPI00244E129B|nr:ran-binding proteins 9/10 homolog [Condylostylus longicornis]